MRSAKYDFDYMWCCLMIIVAITCMMVLGYVVISISDDDIDKDEYVKKCVSMYSTVEQYPTENAFEVCREAYDIGFRNAFPIMQYNGGKR